MALVEGFRELKHVQQALGPGESYFLKKNVFGGLGCFLEKDRNVVLELETGHLLLDCLHELAARRS